MEKVIFAAVPSELYSALVVRFAGVQTDVDAAIKSAIAEYLDPSSLSRTLSLLRVTNGRTYFCLTALKLK